MATVVKNVITVSSFAFRNKFAFVHIFRKNAYKLLNSINKRNGNFSSVASTEVH